MVLAADWQRVGLSSQSANTSQCLLIRASDELDHQQSDSPFVDLDYLPLSKPGSLVIPVPISASTFVRIVDEDMDDGVTTLRWVAVAAVDVIGVGGHFSFNA